MDEETKLFYNLTAQKNADERYENNMLMPASAPHRGARWMGDRVLLPYEKGAKKRLFCFNSSEISS